MTDIKLTDHVSRHEIDGHENDGHEIRGQDNIEDIYRLKIDHIAMQCAILFKTTAEYKSQQRGKVT